MFDARLGSNPSRTPYHSGVWRYKELVYPDLDEKLIVTRPEGNTNLYRFSSLQNWVGSECLYLKHEGENPTGSFKDRGMTGGVTQARCVRNEADRLCQPPEIPLLRWHRLQPSRVTRNCLLSGIATWQLVNSLKQLLMGQCVFVLTQTFDRNLELVRELSIELGIYVLNSINPLQFRKDKNDYV
ncbi:MAG UNVERIFIED_CONTAM: hypothetical protein LVT10_11005 [Anaerolineae bacterium]